MSFITRNVGQFPYFHIQLGKPDWRSKRILDFGGNIGNILTHPDSTIDPEKYWCIDVSKEAIELGRQKNPRAHFVFYNRYSFEYNLEGIEGLPIPETGNKFDYILALSVFTHTSRAEMLELTDCLGELLAAGGCIAFTYLEPHYVPPVEQFSNVAWYIRQRVESDSADLESLAASARDATWCTVANGKLYVEAEAPMRFAEEKEGGYLVFYRSEYIRSLFPTAEILAPVEPFPRQHCCVIRNGTGK
jgi:SAM-dependent methyltransferase